MTARGNHSTPTKPVVLFGIDSRGKPKAARFSKEYAGLALKAASQLELRVLAGNHPKLAAIAARLPVGRVHATGRTFVPFIRRDLYEQLLAAAGNGDYAQSSRSSGDAAGSRPPSSGPRRPQNWQDISVGDVVVAHQSLVDGWYAAVVLGANGDTLTLRWRDYPHERKIVRHRLQLALLYPGSREKAETGRSLRSSSQGKSDRTAPNHPTADSPALPKNWEQIDLNYLVLAMDDGPGRGFWEAIPIERTGDDFKLRWRDHAGLPSISRSRLELALIYSNAA